MSTDTRASTPTPVRVVRNDPRSGTGLAGARPRSNWLAMLPFACALHCMATPLFVAFIPVLAPRPSIEWTLLLISMTVGALALVRGGNVHRHRGVWALAAAGAAIWVGSLLGMFEPLPEVLISPVGGIMLGAGLLWNGRLLHRHACAECGCPMH